MSLLRTALVIPAFVSGVWFAKSPAAAAPLKRAAAHIQTVASPSNPAKVGNADPIIARRLRIEHVLMTLDQVAAVTLQMSPEHSNRIEPVLVDLAEHTLDLVDEDSLRASSTDRELDRIEETLASLMNTINRMVEPEASL